MLRRLFATLRAQTRAFDSVIVVDNGSSDDSVSVSESFGAHVLKIGRNSGFAPAVNAGFGAIDAELIAILNNDVELDPTWLDRLYSWFSDPSVAFVTGKTVNVDDPTKLDGSFDAVCRGGCALRCGSGRKDGPFWATSRRIQFAPFTAVLVRTGSFREVGGLDEAFESYLEDVDFGLRCASIGYTGIYDPSALARHIGSATYGRWDPRTVRYVSRNQVLLIARHYNSRMLLRFGWPIAIAQLLWGLVAIRHGAALAWLSGKAEGVRRFGATRTSTSPQLMYVLEQSERTIHEVQMQTGFDLYWRLYFALTFRPSGQ